MQIIFVLLLGFIVGVALFFLGLPAYRKHLRLQGISEIPIRSMAMGLVRIHGKAAGDRLLTSPISHTPCCVHQVHIEKWRESKDAEGRQSGIWWHYGSEAEGAPFYLEDSTGRVLVNPRGAEYEIERTAIHEASSEKPSSVVVDGVSEVDLLSYVARVGPNKEWAGGGHDLELVQSGLAMSKLRKQGATQDEMMRKFLEIEAGEAPIREPVPAPPPVASIEGVPTAHGRYRLTERCILPGHEHYIIGTCTENPVAKDASDRNLILKGTNEPIFLISALAQPQFNVMLQRGAHLMVFGGGMLAVFCLALLFFLFSLFSRTAHH
jgi:hypothetical protein